MRSISSSNYNVIFSINILLLLLFSTIIGQSAAQVQVRGAIPGTAAIPVRRDGGAINPHLDQIERSQLDRMTRKSKRNGGNNSSNNKGDSQRPSGSAAASTKDIPQSTTTQVVRGRRIASQGPSQKKNVLKNLQ